MANKNLYKPNMHNTWTLEDQICLWIHQFTQKHFWVPAASASILKLCELMLWNGLEMGRTIQMLQAVTEDMAWYRIQWYQVDQVDSFQVEDADVDLHKQLAAAIASGRFTSHNMLETNLDSNQDLTFWICFLEEVQRRYLVITKKPKPTSFISLFDHNGGKKARFVPGGWHVLNPCSWVQTGPGTTLALCQLR